MNDVIKEKKSALLREKYDVIKHKSGLTIYVFPKNMSNTYALFATHYGSVDNGFMLDTDASPTSVPDGIAHFLEHKMFTCEDGSDAFDRFAELGADANAYTSYDKTVFLFSCTSHFSECLAELIDFVMTPYFTEQSVAKEQGIIAEEIGMYDDNPSSRSYFAMLSGLYKNHDIRKNICGTKESIKRITPELLYRCHKVFYNPSNMALVVCGNVCTEEVLKITDAHLPVRAPVNIVRRKVTEPPRAQVSRTECRMQLAKPIFDIGIKDTAIPASAAERERRDVGITIIGDLLFSQTSEIYGELYRDGLISPGMGSSYTLSSDFGFYTLSGESDDPDEVFRRICDFTEKKLSEGFTDEEFERCRKVFYSSFVREFDSTDDIANNLLAYAFEGYDLFGYADIIASIRREEAVSMFRELFRPECITLSVVRPFDGKE